MPNALDAIKRPLIELLLQKLAICLMRLQLNYNHNIPDHMTSYGLFLMI